MLHWLNYTLALCGLVQIVVIACVTPGAAADRTPGTQRPSFTVPPELHQSPAVSLEDLLAKSEKTRLLSVMVRLKVDPDSGDKAERSAIKAAQEKLQQGLSGTGFRVKRLFRYVPFATLEVDPGALRRLAKLDVVAGVSEEAEYYPHLAQTTQLVDASWSFRQAFSGRGAAVAIIDGGVSLIPSSATGWWRSSASPVRDRASRASAARALPRILVRGRHAHRHHRTIATMAPMSQASRPETGASPARRTSSPSTRPLNGPPSYRRPIRSS